MSATQSQTTIPARGRNAVIVWLSLCLMLVGMMVIIGGLTRLTESGLSIVQWKPISGILPPMSETQWAQEFTDYQASPQFKKTFPDMGLEEFRHIYWLEYIHRLVGRLSGMVFLLPLVWFSYKGWLEALASLKLAGIFALGGAQGLIGWFMVKSGLMSEPHVSPIMLAFHLATGFIIFALILWQQLSYRNRNEPVGDFALPCPHITLRFMACVAVLLIFAQVILGAGVAGLHAGLTYNTFPLMDGKWLPEGLWPAETWYESLFSDVTTIQFCHRMMAYALALIVPLFWFIGRNNPHVAHLLPILFSIFVVQFLLGVLTLLFVVPVPLASLHQTNALLLFAIAVAILHRLFLPLKFAAYDVGGKATFT